MDGACRTMAGPPSALDIFELILAVVEFDLADRAGPDAGGCPPVVAIAESHRVNAVCTVLPIRADADATAALRRNF